MCKLAKGSVVALLILIACTGVRAATGLHLFSGLDDGIGPIGPWPISTATAATFDSTAADLGISAKINFEGDLVGDFTSLSVAPGVTMTGINVLGGDQSVFNSPDFPADPALGGFNTTPGGSQYADVDGGTLTFTFKNPIQFFGAYCSGVQTFFTDEITFSDGASQSVLIPTGAIPDGGVAFVGFTDPGASITSVTINTGSAISGYDDIGIDDVRYQSVPEPVSLVGLVAGSATLLRRRRRTASPV